ncbi:restriction endonuclease subunit S [Nonomuraea sp. B10E15]|uniref:restriction endonuclease subunit S n=1 Tax=Nonomuraea sp. B10E15 TaxID=3153560 RepID=UPI00325E9CA0
MRNISQRALSEIELAVPPLIEQQQIVELLEGQLVRVEVGLKYCHEVAINLIELNRSIMLGLRDKALSQGGELVRLGDIASTTLGKMLDSKRNEGIPTPYLRNVNVRWGKFDLSNIETVPMSEDQRRHFALESGDLLVCEGGEPGRCAIWPGSASLIAYQKALHRIRPSGKVKPQWLEVMIQEAARNGRMTGLLTGTTIKHLPQEKLRSLLIPLPSVDVQDRLVEEFESMRQLMIRLESSMCEAVLRAKSLRGMLLSEGVGGRLTPRLAHAEPVSGLLEQIRKQRTAHEAVRRLGGRQGQELMSKASRTEASSGTILAPISTSAPKTSIQETLL